MAFSTRLSSTSTIGERAIYPPLLFFITPVCKPHYVHNLTLASRTFWMDSSPQYGRSSKLTSMNKPKVVAQ
eukprot:scaffold74136_cov61-Attheya_sp.AAC.3